MDDQISVENLRQQHLIAKLIYDPEFRANHHYIQPKDFVHPSYVLIMKAIKKLLRKHEAIDALSIREIVGEVEIPTKSIIDETINYEALAKRLHEEGSKWRTKLQLSDFIEHSSDDGFDFEKELQAVIKKINEPLESSLELSTGDVMLQQFADYLENKKDDVVVGKTGIPRIDSLIQNIEMGHIYVIEAAQATGKSLLGAQIFHESMGMGTPCLLVSNEMLKEDIFSRLLARLSGIDSRKIKRGAIDIASKEYGMALGELADMFRKSNSVIMEKAHDIEKTKQAIRLCVNKYGTKLVVVDHLQNFHSNKDLYDKISYVAHEFQELAQELNVAIVMLSQLSANSMDKDIERANAKGSKDVDEVANVVIILQRKKIATGTTVEKADDPRWMRLIVVKNRDGETGEVWASLEVPSLVLKEDANDWSGI
jgi:replicative DNA helicase